MLRSMVKKEEENILKQTNAQASGFLGGLMKVARFMGGGRNVRWFIEARLDIPWGIDVSKKVRVYVAEVDQLKN